MTLSFNPVRIEDHDLIYPYTSAYGEGSCQHSPVSMFSLSEKYGDSVCEDDGVLYTLRSNLCDDVSRVYLAPLTDGDLERAFGRIFDDAASYGKNVKFITLTEKHAGFLSEHFPGRFSIEEDRDLAEYMYKADVMAAFSGSELRKRRAEIHTFHNHFGDRASFSRITHDDFDEILGFERRWLERNLETHDKDALERDARMIEKQLDHFDALKLFGIILRIDGKMCGFTYGAKLSDSVYDVIVEKADRDIPHSYKVLRQESAKLCTDCEYINYEEDVGIPGLRRMKTSYKPAFLLRKYTATGR